MNKYSIYLGAVGWEHAHWTGSFYPDDLPADWELSFYNTQFRCVYLPYELWSQASDMDVENWLSETQEDFRFVLQMPGNFSESEVNLVGKFGKRGVRDDEVDLIWVEGSPELRGLAKQMQTAAEKGAPLYLFSRDGDPTQMRQLNELIQVLGF